VTILVTGASGFIGSAVVRRLLGAGYAVRALLRPQSEQRNVEGLSIEIVKGDLTERTSLEQAVIGCDALFHVAADYRIWVPDPQRIYRINVTGTRDLMLAAADAGVKRIVYTSSVATLGLTADGTPATEDTPVSLADMIGHYKRSKYLAEEEVCTLAKNASLPVVIVNPTAPIGPRDIKPTPTGRLVLDAACGRMPAYVDTGLNLVHVDDVALGHLLAFERGRIGERYILGGQNMTLKEILSLIARLTGRQAPRLRLPHGVLVPVADIAEAWARVCRQEPRITVDGVHLARKRMFFSTDKARHELGFEARPVEQALSDAISWFRENGYLNRSNVIARQHARG
jgi:dihydroflavonol-4-reductase